MDYEQRLAEKITELDSSYSSGLVLTFSAIGGVVLLGILDVNVFYSIFGSILLVWGTYATATSIMDSKSKAVMKVVEADIMGDIVTARDAVIAREEEAIKGEDEARDKMMAANLQLYKDAYALT